jgi:hypothetical protein
MPLDGQFSLSVELTKLLPLGPILNTVGRSFLNLARDLHNSGSDIVVEADLANVFGRNRIESRFESTFRTAVKESYTQRLNYFLDIVLEGGAGPTVHRSLTDQAYFSTVVQLSLLTSMLDLRSLAAGLHHVFTRRAEAISLESSACPGYENLLGTLRAIRDQTSGFSWNLIADAVTSSFGQGFEEHRARIWPRSGSAWVMPTIILQGCLDFFTMVQHFPEERIVQIKTSAGSQEHQLHRLLIIWAHHVLGLTVVLCYEDGGVFGRFGEGHENVIIVACQFLYDVEISLLDGTRQDLFRISGSIDDPEISADERVKAGGFATRYLAGRKDLSQQIIRQTLESCKLWCEESHHTGCSDRLQRAADFIYREAFDSVRDGTQNPHAPPPHDHDEEIVLPLTRALYAFAHVENLDALQEMPVSLRELRGLNRKIYSGAREAFGYMTRLLLGIHDIKNPVLVSCRGWSVYTNIITLPDPTDVSAPLMYVSRGVPSRAGERKQFIIDGTAPRRTRTPDVRYNALDTVSAVRLVCEFDVSKLFWFVGTSSVAFEVIVKIELEPHHQPTSRFHGVLCRKMFKAGLLELEALALRSQKTAPCYHAESAIGSEFAVPSGCRVFSSTIDFYKARDTSSSSTFISLSAGSASARWFCLLYSEEQRHYSLAQAGQLVPERIFIRDRSCCPKCCIAFVEDITRNESTNSKNLADLAIIIL